MWFCSSEVSMKFRQKCDLSPCLAGWPQCSWLCVMNSASAFHFHFVFLGSCFFLILLIFLRCWALLHCPLKQTPLKWHLCKHRTGMEFSILLESVYLSKPANFSRSRHASFLRKNFSAPTWNFQWKQPAQSPRQPVCQGTDLPCERSRVKFLAPRKIPLVI